MKIELCTLAYQDCFSRSPHASIPDLRVAHVPALLLLRDELVDVHLRGAAQEVAGYLDAVGVLAPAQLDGVAQRIP